MKAYLRSSLWAETKALILKCHLSLLDKSCSIKSWELAFLTLFSAIEEERKYTPNFANELDDLTEDSGFDYDFKDILEEYFNHLENSNEWELVIKSANKVIDSFVWQKTKPSEYMYRIGNALQKEKRFDEALSFGKKWLEDYPKDYYAVASNVFLLISLDKKEEALALCEKYLSKDLVCDSVTDTFFMAAYRLYEITDDSYAKERVSEKIAEYNKLQQKKNK